MDPREAEVNELSIPKKEEKSAMNIQEGVTISIETIVSKKKSLSPISRSLTPKDQVLKLREIEKKRLQEKNMRLKEKLQQNNNPFISQR